jgi:hypothetical protein
MRYDAIKHRYILTVDHVLGSMNIDLRDVLNTSASADVANEAERVLDRVSKEVYAFIYRVAAFRFTTERALAKDHDARPFLLSAMEEQLLYMLQNGDLAVQSGVNVQNVMAIDKTRLRAAEIAPLAYDIMMDSGFVCAAVPRGLRDISPRYAEEEY